MTGNEYRSLRCKKHMTQEYVARLIGISRAALSGYEAERFDIPLLVALSSTDCTESVTTNLINMYMKTQ